MNRYYQYMYSYPHKTAYRQLSDCNLEEYMHFLSGNGHSLYIHIPFCESKCGYCNLFSVTGTKEDFWEKYIAALIRQMKQYQEMLPKDTVFEDITIGGGTPLILPVSLLKQLFDSIFSLLPVKKDCEIIIETAPLQTTKEKMDFLKKQGVTRVSLGVQSFHLEELKYLRRAHLPECAKKAAEIIREADFSCFNMDFIYGIPFQTKESLVESLKKACDFSPDEIFLYPLYIKHGVKLLEERNVPDPEHTYELYEEGKHFLQEMGYFQKSMRRFTKRSEQSFVECGMNCSLSLGCGGRSYLGNLHACTPYQITRCSAMNELNEFIGTMDFTKVKHGILLEPEELRRRYVIKHLFTLPGISIDLFEKDFKCELFSAYPILSKWCEEGYCRKEQGMLCLTESGISLSDWLGPQLISRDIEKLMLEWEQKNS